VRPAYKAACSSGCLPVLAVLAGVAAAAPHQHLPVLLEAAAEAGNLQAWRQLLQADSSTQQQQQQQQQRQQQGEHQQEEAAAAAFPRLDWSCLFRQQLTVALHLALPSRNGTSSNHPGSSQEQQWQADEDACRLQMADLLWQQLVVQQGREAALRQHMCGSAGAKHHGAAAAAAAAAGAGAGAAAAALGPSSAVPAAGTSSRMLFGYATIAGSRAMPAINWHELSAARVAWLQQHQLVPEQMQPNAYCAFKGAMELASEAGDFARALRLHNVVNSMDGVPRRHPVSMTAAAVVGSSIGGHLRRACAAGDAAAVAQLERLAGFSRHALVDVNVSLLVRCGRLNPSCWAS